MREKAFLDEKVHCSFSWHLNFLQLSKPATLSNDEGRKISFHFVALPFASAQLPMHMLAPATKVRIGTSTCILQAFPFGNIYYTAKPSMPRDDLYFHPERSRDYITSPCLSIIHQPRQTLIRTSYLWRNGLCLLEDRIQRPKETQYLFHPNSNPYRQKNLSAFWRSIKGSLLHNFLWQFG